jgi:serine protease inhibitor
MGSHFSQEPNDSEDSQSSNDQLQQGRNDEKINLSQQKSCGTLSRSSGNVQTINALSQHKLNRCNKNCFFSTYGLYCLLDLLKSGSSGDIYVALSKIISDENVHSLAKSDDVFKNTSLIFYASYLKLNNVFANYLKTNNILHDPIEMKELSKRIEKINQQLEKMTNNKIKAPLNPDDFDDDFVMLLVNVLYFRAEWYEKFDAIGTKNLLFKNGKNQKIPMMSMHGENYNYYETKTCQYITLPYATYPYRMLIALPKENEKQENVNLDEVLQRMEKHTVTTLTLPKFKIEQEEDLKEECMRMGLNKMFGLNRDFDTMFEDGSSSGPKYIKKIKQKTFINLDENGTEAAAVTYAIANCECLMVPEKYKEVEFIADHPFSFYILGLNNLVLFAGRFFNY